MLLQEKRIKMNRNKSNKEIGMDAEDRVQKCINSGALSFDKGDLKNETHLISVKHTNKKSFRLTLEMFKDIWNTALDRNKLPRMVIELETEDDYWYIVGAIFKRRK